MELRLEDPKSKEDDMGVIIVDVCLMFRDATIKKGPVGIFQTLQVFVWWKSIFLPAIMHSFIAILLNFIEIWTQKK